MKQLEVCNSENNDLQDKTDIFKSFSFHPHNLYVAFSTQYNVNYKMKINKTRHRSMYTHIAVA